MQPSPPSVPIRWRRELAVAALFSLAGALWVLRPALTQAHELGVGPVAFFLGDTGLLAGSGVDLLGTLWTFDFARGLLGGEHGTTAAMFAPVGFDAATAQGLAWLDAWLAAPLVMAMGVPGFYNLHLLLTLAGTGLAAFALFRLAGAPLGWALALSHGVACNHFVFVEIYQGRPTQVHLVFHCLFLLVVVALLQGRCQPRPAALSGGLLLAASCFVYWFTAAGVGVVGACALLAAAARRGPDRRRLLVGGGGIALVALAATLLPASLVVPHVLGLGEGAAPQLFAGTGVLWQWGGLRVLGGEAPLRLDQAWQAGSLLLEYGLPGVVIAAGLASLAFPRRVWGWLSGAVLTASMCLGPLVVVGSRLVPTFSALLQQVWPYLARCNHPQRFVVATILALSVAAATAGGRAASRLPGRWPSVAPWVVGALFVVAVQARSSMVPSDAGTRQVLPAAAFYQQLASLQPGGIIDLPLEVSNVEFVYAVVHRQPILGGMGITAAETRPVAHREYVDTNSWLRALKDVVSNVGGRRAFDDADRRRLWDDGFRVVVLHGPDSLRRRVEPFLGMPFLVEGKRAAYIIPGGASPQP